MKNLQKTACALLTAAALTLTLAGCSSGKPKDGTYTARYRYPSGGYIEYLTVTFQNGKPNTVDFDAYLEADPDSRKSATDEQSYPMTPHPSQWMPQLEKNLVAAGTNPDKVASVAGATASSQRVREMYDAILKAAAEGKTAEIILENQPEDAGLSDSSSMTGDSTGAENDTGTNADDSMNPDGSADSDAGGENTDNSTGSSDSTGTVGDGTTGDAATDGATDSGAAGTGTGTGTGTGAGTGSGTGGAANDAGVGGTGNGTGTGAGPGNGTGAGGTAGTGAAG